MAVEALWPQVDPALARQRVWAAISDVGKAVRGATGGKDVLVRSGGRCPLDSSLVSCDLWALEGVCCTKR